MTKHVTQSTSALWARFRFSVVGTLLSAPPARGELWAALESLAATTWTHPVTGHKKRFAAKTLERWLYRAGKSGMIRWQSCGVPCGKIVGRCL